MLTLCIDTAYKYLTCALILDNELLAYKSYECFKKQSEEVFVCLDNIFKENNLNRKDIDSICISEGPGSYTGVRIAMSIAKVIGEVKPCDVYTISTLKLYASNNENTMVILNARADRAYVGIYNKSDTILEDCVLEVKDIKADNYNVIGDGSLLGLQDHFENIAEAFLKTKSTWSKVQNIRYLVPKYLKESESYLK